MHFQNLSVTRRKFFYNKELINMKKQVSAILAAMVFAVGAQGVASAAPISAMGVDRPALVMLDEEEEDVTLVVDEPVESGDILVDEDGDVWEVQ